MKLIRLTKIYFNTYMSRHDETLNFTEGAIWVNTNSITSFADKTPIKHMFKEHVIRQLTEKYGDNYCAVYINDDIAIINANITALLYNLEQEGIQIL